MTSYFDLNDSLQSRFWPQENKLLKNLLLIVGGILVLAIASQLSIPLKPVPLTFQSATVLLIGMVYGARLGAATVGAYLIAGACGVPLFAEWSGGIHVFFGPTGGYLIGFFFAAMLSGYLTQRGWGRHFFTTFINAILGAAIIFLLGVIVLSIFVGWGPAFTLGVKPFLISEPIKLLAVAFIAPRFWKKAE